jgi:hypothetical protein
VPAEKDNLQPKLGRFLPPCRLGPQLRRRPDRRRCDISKTYSEQIRSSVVADRLGAGPRTKQATTARGYRVPRFQEPARTSASPASPGRPGRPPSLDRSVRPGRPSTGQDRARRIRPWPRPQPAAVTMTATRGGHCYGGHRSAVGHQPLWPRGHGGRRSSKLHMVVATRRSELSHPAVAVSVAQSRTAYAGTAALLTVTEANHQFDNYFYGLW